MLMKKLMAITGSCNKKIKGTYGIQCFDYWVRADMQGV